MFRFICLCLLSLSYLSRWTGATSTGPRHLLVQVPTEDGRREVYGKDAEGRAVKIVNFDQYKSEIGAVSLVSDGRAVVVKSEFDQDGHLIDCQLIDNPNDIRNFVDHVDENVQKSLTRSNPERDIVMASKKLPRHRSVFDVHSQVKSCQQLKSGRGEMKLMEELEESGKRAKRSYLIWPGTNWCGKGSKAEFADSYGPNKETDQCCKKHDQCPYIIEGFTTRYNLFNYRVHTLSHCDCDLKFMDCLKDANTTTSSMVGKVYFNVVNTECFELSLQKTCARRSWWGGCEKYTTKWTATVKTLGNYPESG